MWIFPHTIISGVVAPEKARRGISPRSTGPGQDAFLPAVTPCEPPLCHKHVVVTQEGCDTGGTVPERAPSGSKLDLLGARNHSYIIHYQDNGFYCSWKAVIISHRGPCHLVLMD